MIGVLGQGAFGTGGEPACRAGPGTRPAERRVPEESGTPPLPRSSQSNTSNTQHLFFIHKHQGVMGTSATRVRSERRFHATLTYRAVRACVPSTLRLRKRNYKFSTLEWLSLLHPLLAADMTCFYCDHRVLCSTRYRWQTSWSRPSTQRQKRFGKKRDKVFWQLFFFFVVFFNFVSL